LALKLSGVDPDSEVITTSMTCIASVTPISNLGAKIVWADIQKETGNISVDSVKKLITKKTKAVLCVDWAGLPCDLIALQNLCRLHDIKSIQDAAHGFGSNYEGKSICHFADFTCYSFQAIKHITCGDGGLLVCANKGDYTRAKNLKWFGFDRDGCKTSKGEWKGQRWEVDIDEAGYKFYMNNISAAIGLSQLKHIDNVLSSHKNNAKIYAKHFSDKFKVDALTFPIGGDPAYWVYTVLLDESVDRDGILKNLNDMGIGAGLVHIPCHNYSCFSESFTELPMTDYFHTHQLSFPCGWWLTDCDVKNIINEMDAML